MATKFAMEAMTFQNNLKIITNQTNFNALLSLKMVKYPFLD